jgi:methionyl-tRNA formyltransferase
MRVVFFGTPAFSASILEALAADKDIEVVGVVCQPDEPVGRKKILTAPPTKTFATSRSIPVFQPTKLKDVTFLTSIDSLKADVAVIVAYGRILPKVLLDRVPGGFINVHPSLLPKYRGPSPMQAAIAAEDTVTGVTIMKIDEGMDTGPILAQISIDLNPRETTESLTAKVVNLGALLLVNSLKGYMSGSIKPQPQSTDGISICRLLTKDDGKIDWTLPATSIDAKIRAYTPWPGCWTVWQIRGTDLQAKILKAEPIDSLETIGASTIGTPVLHGNSLVIPAGNSTFLKINTLQPAGGKAMSGSDFARGYLK